MKRSKLLARRHGPRNWFLRAISLGSVLASLAVPSTANAEAGDPGSIQMPSGSYLEATNGVTQVVPSENWTIEGYVKLDVTSNQKYLVRGYSGVNGTTKEIEIYNGPAGYWAMKGLLPNETNHTGLLGSYTLTTIWLRFVFQQNGVKACGTVQYTDSNPTSSASWKFGGVWVCTGDTSPNVVANRRSRLTSTSPITKWVIGSNEAGQGLTAKFANVHISNVARYSFDSNLAFPSQYSSADANTALLIGTSGDASNYLDISGNSTVVGVNSISTSTAHPFLGPAKTRPTLALTSNSNPSVVQDSVTFTATPNVFDSGTLITFMDGASAIGTCTVTTISCSHTDSSLGAGTHSITASIAGSAHYLSATSNTVTQSVGTLATSSTWSVSENPTQGEAITFASNVLPVSATGTVTFRDSNDNTLCTTGNLVLGAGTCNWSGGPTRGNYEVTPTYNGDANHSRATGATRSVSIYSTQSALIWDLAGTSIPYLGSLALSTGGGSGSGAVVYSVSDDSTCAVWGSTLIVGDAGSTCEVTATKAAANNYFAASTTPQRITVAKIDQADTLVLTNSTAMMFGESLGLLATGGSGGGEVTYLVARPGSAGCTIVGSTLSVTGAGTCDVNARRAESTNYNPTGLDAQATQTITVSTAPQTVRFTSMVPTSPVAGGTYVVSAVSSSSLPAEFAISSGDCVVSGSIVTFGGRGDCVVSASQSGDNQYSVAPAISQTISVGRRNQTISFDAASSAIGTKVFGDNAFSMVATSTEQEAVPLYSRGPDTTNSACDVTSKGVVTVHNVGICQIKANAAGSSKFAAASEISQNIYINPDLPNSPYLISTSAGNRSINATFTPPTYEGGSAVTGYQLLAVDQTPGSNVTVSESGCDTALTSGVATCTVSGLENGVNYKVKVLAITVAGAGDFSELSRTISPVTNPAAVQRLRVIEIDSAFNIAWAEPDSLGGGTFSAYRVFIKQSGEANYDQSHYFNVTDDSTHSITVTQESPANGFGFNGGPSLVNGLSYDVKVVTVTTANAAEMSANTAEANKVPRTVPGVPALVEPLEVGANLVLSWAAPTNDGGAAITSYSAQFDDSPCELANPTATTCEVAKPLEPGTYSYQVTAENIAGQSAPATRTFTVVAPTPTPSPSPSRKGPAGTSDSTSPTTASGQPTLPTKNSTSEAVNPPKTLEPDSIHSAPSSDSRVNQTWLWSLFGGLVVLGIYFGLRSQHARRQDDEI